MLRTPATNLLRNGMVRSNVPLTRAASTVHAISKPTLANIEKRWEGMPLQEQADLWMALRDRMKGSWKELTVQEQKAGACFYNFFFFVQDVYRCTVKLASDGKCVPKESITFLHHSNAPLGYDGLGFETQLPTRQLCFDALGSLQIAGPS